MASSLFRPSSFVTQGKLLFRGSPFVYKHVHFQSMFSGRTMQKMLSSRPQWICELKQKETSSETKRICSTLSSTLYQHQFLANDLLVLRNQCVCYSSKKSKSKQKPAKRGADTDDESDDEEEVDVDDSEALSEGEDEIDDGAVKKDWKDLKMNVPSLRIDAIMSSGLGVSRKKVEEAFLSGKLRHNGKKVMKKSRQVQEGDILDAVKENSIVNREGSQVMVVMRVQMRKIKDEKTSTDKTPVKLRRWKHLEVPKEK